LPSTDIQSPQLRFPPVDRLADVRADFRLREQPARRIVCGGALASPVNAAAVALASAGAPATDLPQAENRQAAARAVVANIKFERMKPPGQAAP
jgi:hypothetical protein